MSPTTEVGLVPASGLPHTYHNYIPIPAFGGFNHVKSQFSMGFPMIYHHFPVELCKQTW